MKYHKSVLIAMLGVISLGFADQEQEQNYMEEKAPAFDIASIEEQLDLGRRIKIRGLGGELSLEGEVRSEIQFTSETNAGLQKRGRASEGYAAPFAGNDIEANLGFKYKNDDSWAQVKIKFDNDQGIGSGTSNKIAVGQAIFGTKWLDADSFSLTTVVGRSWLGSHFDSKIQFGSPLDGVAVSMESSLDNVGQLYCHLAPFVINENFNRYGGAIELGAVGVFNTGLFSKLSYVDWDLGGASQTRTDRMVYGHKNLQATVGYQSTLPYLNVPVNLYAAGLVNLKDASDFNPALARANKGAYIGMSLGLLGEPRSFAFDINYQWVQARAVSEFDAACIGRGNIGRTGLYTSKLRGGGDLLNIEDGIGIGNFKGFAVEFVYQITQNLKSFQSFKKSNTLSSQIGPDLDYYQAEVELIYAF